MKNTLKVFFIILFLVLLASLGYLFYLYILPRWAMILFYLYFLIGIVFYILSSIIFFKDLSKSKSIKDELLGSIAKVFDKKKIISQFRSFISTTFTLIELAILWPIEIIIGLIIGQKRQIKSPKDAMLYNSIELKDPYHSIFAFSIIIIIYILGQLGLNGQGYGQILIIIFGLSVVSRHIHYTFEIEGLPTRLRRTSTNPYLIFVMIILFDFLSLILSCVLIVSGYNIKLISLVDLETTSSILFRFREYFRFVSGEKLIINEVLVSIFGLFFYLALLRILLRFKEFKKQDVDYHWLANKQNMLGNFSNALRILKNIKTKTIVTELYSIIGLIGVNELEQAEERAKSFIIQKGDNPDKNKVFQVLIDACVIDPIPKNIVLSVLKRAIEQKVDDVRIQDAVGLFSLSNEEYVSVLHDRLSPIKAEYPLAFANLNINMGNYLEAQNTLASATPGTELEEIVRLTMNARATLSNNDTNEDEDSIFLNDWLKINMPVIKNLLTNLDNAWEKAIIFGQLLFIRHVVTSMAEEWEQELIYILDQIKSQVDGNQVAETMVKSMELRWKNISDN